MCLICDRIEMIKKWTNPYFVKFAGVKILHTAFIAERKHKNMKNSMDFSKIEVNGKLLGVLNFNLMIPIEEEQLQHVDTIIFKRDRENIRYYKKLCAQELEWCQANSEVICNKVNVLYKNQQITIGIWRCDYGFFRT